MFAPGTQIKMTKGYRGVKGVIVERTASAFPLYVVQLDNGISMVAGPTAFVALDE
jgi:hypothetical protein